MSKLLCPLLTAGLLTLNALPALADDAAPYARPERFYDLITSHNSSVCGDVLASLNKRYSLLSSTTAPDRDRLAGQFLLQSDMQVHWSLVVGEKGEYLESAKVKLQNDGKEQTVYRFPFTVGNMTADMVGTVPTEAASLSDIGSLTPNQASRKITAIEGSPLSLLVPAISTTPQWKSKKDAPEHLGSPSMLFVDFIVFSGGTYMLATPAKAAQDLYQSSVLAGSDRKPATIDVYLLQLVKETEVPMVCHFRHRAKQGAEARRGRHRRGTPVN